MADEKPYKANPIDPNAGIEDATGEGTGRSGALTNTRNKKGNTPERMDIDKTHQSGGAQPVKEDKPVIPEEMVSDREYNKNTLRNMSGSRSETNESFANEKDDTGISESSVPSGDDTLRDTGGGVDNPIANYRPEIDEKRPDGTKYIGTNEASNTGEYNQGEQDSAGGTTAVAGTDDDVGEMRERVTGKKDDMENPEEIDTAKIIDEAQEDNRTH